MGSDRRAAGIILFRHLQLEAEWSDRCLNKGQRWCVIQNSNDSNDIVILRLQAHRGNVEQNQNIIFRSQSMRKFYLNQLVQTSETQNPR